MSEEGFDDRRKAGEQRIAERNAEDLGPTLEGPGSEARLQRLQHKFRSVGGGAGRRDPGASTLILIGLAVFLTILVFGLAKPVIEKMAAQVSGQTR